MTGNPRGDRFRTLIVVPCFNEAQRIDLDQFADFAAQHPDFSFLFVNDGSTDATLAILQALQARNPAWCEVLNLEVNRGKAEAVRRGMMHASADRPDAVGYFDADLATPLDALPRMADVLRRRPETHLVMGTRIRLQGHHIQRKWSRRVLGRSFAFVASLTLGLSIVDTQCGAKLFRGAPQIDTLFSEPFRSRWIFDIEILARLQQHLGRKHAAKQLYAFPLESWREVPGSKLKSTDFFKAVGELLGNFWQYRLQSGFGQRSTVETGSPVASPSPTATRDELTTQHRAA